MAAVAMPTQGIWFARLRSAIEFVVVLVLAVGGIPRLDHAINAGLLLLWAGLKTGDRVGLFAFDERVRHYSRPRGGIASFPVLQRRTAEIDYSTGETNYTVGLMSLLTRLSRRTLIVLFTEFVDTVTTELMLENLKRLTRRHLVISVTLRDPGLLAVAATHPGNAKELYRAVVADDLIREREQVIERLLRAGPLHRPGSEGDHHGAHRCLRGKGGVRGPDGHRICLGPGGRGVR